MVASLLLNVSLHILWRLLIPSLRGINLFLRLFQKIAFASFASSSSLLLHVRFLHVHVNLIG